MGIVTNKTSNSLSVVDPVPFIKGGSQHHVVLLNGREYTGMDGRSIHNALLVTELDEKTRDFIVFDIFQHQVYFVTCPPWEDPTTFFPHRVTEGDLLNFRAWLETRGIKINTKDADDILLSLAQRNKINPPRDWFNTLKWDGKPILDNWLINACDAQDDERYLQLVGSKWVIAAVKRIFEPGCKFDSTLILEGGQGWEKSKAFEMLATVNGVKYFLDEAMHIGDKDSLMKLQGKIIFEMAELATLQRGGETEEMKAFQSRREDIYREPYSRKVITRPRMFVIGGTINPMGGYLTDATGARRIWPVECGKKLDTEWLELHKEQMWAEAVYRYKQGEKIWLVDDEVALAEVEQRKRFKQAINHDSILDSIKKVEQRAVASGRYHFSIDEIMEGAGIDRIEKKTHHLNQQIKETLVFYGYVTCRPREIKAGEQTRGEKWIHQKYKRGKNNSVPLYQTPFEF